MSGGMGMGFAMAVVKMWRLFKAAAGEWIGNNPSRLGAALAFYSVLSLSPLVLLALTIAGMVWNSEAAQAHILHQSRLLIGPEAASAVETVMKAAQQNKAGGTVASIVSFGSLIFSASAACGELQDSLNLIWKVPTPKGEAVWIYLRNRAFAIVMMIGGGLLLVLSVAASAMVGAVSRYALSGAAVQSLGVSEPLIHGINFGASYLVVTLLFAVIFKAVPDAAVPWRAVWGGAVLTALLFNLGKAGIAFYLSHAGVASGYGAAGSLVVLLLWIYYTAQILFFGAEFAFVTARGMGGAGVVADGVEVYSS